MGGKENGKAMWTWLGKAFETKSIFGEKIRRDLWNLRRNVMGKGKEGAKKDWELYVGSFYKQKEASEKTLSLKTRNEFLGRFSGGVQERYAAAMGMGIGLRVEIVDGKIARVYFPKKLGIAKNLDFEVAEKMFQGRPADRITLRQLEDHAVSVIVESFGRRGEEDVQIAERKP